MTRNLTLSCALFSAKGLFSRGVPGGERGVPRSGPTEVGRADQGTFVEQLYGVFPGEADATVHLDRRPGRGDEGLGRQLFGLVGQPGDAARAGAVGRVFAGRAGG